MSAIVQGRWILEGFDGDEPRLHENAALLIANGKVAQIGKAETVISAHPEAQRHGGPDCLVTPGFINAHHHVGLTPFQTGSEDQPLELWFATRMGLRSVEPYLDTLYSAFEMIASGVTTVQHLHSRAPGRLQGLYDTSRAVLEAYANIGMRVSYSMAFRDQNRLVYEADDRFIRRLPSELGSRLSAWLEDYAVDFEDQIRLTRDLFEEVADKPLAAVQLAPSNLHWLSDAALEKTARFAHDTGAPMHAHLVETAYQKAYAKRRTGGSALAYFDALGLVSDRLTIGHGVWLSESDIELCAERGCHICHNCSSNLRLKSGIAPLNRFHAKGLRVAIGIDEAGLNDDRDMLQEMRLALRLHREPGLNAPAPSAAQIVRMATEHGAATTPFGESIGRLSPGSQADLVAWDWDRITYPFQDPAIDPLSVLIARGRSGLARTVWIGGDIVFDAGRFARVDRAVTLEAIREKLSVAMPAATAELRSLGQALLPHVRSVYDDYDLGSPTAHVQYSDSSD